MERTPVDSSVIESIGYSIEDDILEVGFLSGSVYQYFHVPIEVFKGFIDASSHGQYFNSEVKPNYRYLKVF